MGRTDRLYALVEELRARAPRVVARTELAERLEVSTRTIERDVLTLQQAGVPIWAQRGRFGGYAIEPGTTLPPLNLDAAEALAVISALAVLPSLPFASAGRRAQQKLLAAMRNADAEKAQEVAQRIRTVAPSTKAIESEVMRSIEQAVIGRRVLELLYQDRHGASTTRTVEAHGLHLTQRSGYLIGWCRLRDAGRAFRLDRIEKAIVQDEIAPVRDVDPMLDWVEGATAPDVFAQRPTSTTTTRNEKAYEPLTAVIRAIVADLPEVDEEPHHGWPGFTVRGHFFTVLQAPNQVWLRATPADEEHLVTTRPEVFRRHRGLQARTDRLSPDEFADLVVQAWRLTAPRALVTP